MIEVELINGSHIMLNSDLIEFIEATPDTVISLSNGKKMIVKNSVPDVVTRIVEFRRKISTGDGRGLTKRPDSDHPR